MCSHDPHLATVFAHLHLRFVPSPHPRSPRKQHELLIRIYYIAKVLNASEFTNIINSVGGRGRKVGLVTGLGSELRLGLGLS